MLELLEYKLADLQAGRQVKGGISAVWDLYNYLSRDISVLSEEHQQQLTEAGRSLRRFTETPKKAKGVLETLESLIIEDFAMTPSEPRGGTPVFEDPPPILDMDPEVLEEQAVLQRLAKRVWWSEMDTIIQELAAQCRAEKDRTTARLVYALGRNLEKHFKKKKKITDVGLSRYEVLEAVPERSDPLISLNDLESISALIRDVVEVIVSLGENIGPYANVDMPRGQALGYVKRMALAIAREPYAGRLSAGPQQGPSSDQIRLAIQELSKEPLPEDQMQVQREALEERLRVTAAHERQQRDTFQADVQAFTAAAKAFFDRLEPFLPGKVGGEAGEPQLAGGVLFAINPVLRVNAIPRDANAITVRLKGPTRFMLGGLEIALTGTGNAHSLYVGGQDHVLQPRLSINLGRHSVVVNQEGNYVHLKIVDEGRSLATLLAEGLAVFYVLNNPEKDNLMRVLKTAANITVSEPKELVGQALDRLKEMSSRAPNRRQALEGLVRGAAKGLNISLRESTISGLIERFMTAMSVSAGDLQQVLNAAGSTHRSIYHLGDDPLSVALAGQPVTIRKYSNRSEKKDNVVVMLPGQIVGSFVNYMVKAFPGGTLLCVRSEEEIACLFFEGMPVEA